MDILFSCYQNTEFYRLLLDYRNSSKGDGSFITDCCIKLNTTRWRGTLSRIRCSFVGTGLQPRPKPKQRPIVESETVDSNNVVVSVAPSIRLCFQIEKLVFAKRYTEALNLFEYMESIPDSEVGKSTYNAMVTACLGAKSVGGARMLHMHMVGKGFVPDRVLSNRVLFMFIKCGMPSEACHFFDQIRNKDPTSWEIMVGGLVNSGEYKDAFNLFIGMWREPRDVGPRTLVALVRACIGLASVFLGRQLHAFVVKMGFSENIFLSCACIDMYSKCGNIKDARLMFDEMPEKTTVGWNTTMAAYALHGYNDEALSMFNEMSDCGVEIDHFTFSILVRICTRLASLRRVKQIHARLLRCGFWSDIGANTALIDFYGKWGDVEYAKGVFHMIPNKNVMSWNALIAAYGIQGRGSEAVSTFESMSRRGVVPDHVTFLAVLTACTRSGMPEYTWEVFRSMSMRYGVNPRPMHYACVVELFGREGLFDRAFELIEGAPFNPTVNIWAALITACRAHRKEDLAKLVAEKIYEMGPDKLCNYVMLLNLYRKSGEKSKAEMVIQTMKRMGIEIHPSCSWVDVDNQLRAFTFGEKMHPGLMKVYEELDRLMKEIRKVGYVEQESMFLPDVGVEEAGNVRYHSEKLAVAYGVMSTDQWLPLQVMQSHRMCTDCHNVIKLVSIVTRRKIVVRDGTRFHHFNYGRCSCGDYW